MFCRWRQITSIPGDIIDNASPIHPGSHTSCSKTSLCGIYPRSRYSIVSPKTSTNTVKMSATVAPRELIHLYRSFIRELPARGLRSSPTRLRIRDAIKNDKVTGMAKADQYLTYIKAQRMYATLLERYNPGMNMEEEERVKLTARRVGMELPLEYEEDGKKK